MDLCEKLLVFIIAVKYVIPVVIFVIIIAWVLVHNYRRKRKNAYFKPLGRLSPSDEGKCCWCGNKSAFFLEGVTDKADEVPVEGKKIVRLM